MAMIRLTPSLASRRRFLNSALQTATAATLAAPLIIRAAENTPGKIHIGQIGTGHAHAAGKLAALRKLPDYELAGVVEPDETLRLAAMKDKAYANVRWLTEEQLLNTPKLQAVAVETGVKHLLATGQRAIAAGMHLHLDKPAGESLPRFRQLLAEAERRKLTIQMGYMFRYNPAFQFCFQAVREGWLGEIFAIEAAMSKAVAVGARQPLLPYRGGAMFELGCHVIDAVVLTLGQPQRVTPFHRHSGQFADDLLDNQVAVLEYPRATVTVRSALLEVNGEARRQFVVCGDQGTVDIRPLEPPQLRLALATERGRYQRGYQEVNLPSLPRYEADLMDLAKIIRGEKQSGVSYAHDLTVQETVLRASGLPTT